MRDLWPDRPTTSTNPLDQRKSHYGEGEQPIDRWLKVGWGPISFAIHVDKYLHRPGKSPEHSRESARRYYAMLQELVYEEKYSSIRPHSLSRSVGASHVLEILHSWLTPEEIASLQAK